jgi:hypothetical protein
MADNGARGSVGMAEAVRRAVREFAGLVQQEPERISGIRRVEDGWSVLVDVVELERVPSTTSVLATYRVDLDAGGEMRGYERLRRFTRATTDES